MRAGSGCSAFWPVFPTARTTTCPVERREAGSSRNYGSSSTGAARPVARLPMSPTFAARTVPIDDLSLSILASMASVAARPDPLRRRRLSAVLTIAGDTHGVPVRRGPATLAAPARQYRRGKVRPALKNASGPVTGPGAPHPTSNTQPDISPSLTARPIRRGASFEGVRRARPRATSHPPRPACHGRSRVAPPGTFHPRRSRGAQPARLNNGRT